MQNQQAHTPLMQQFWDIKNRHLDKILLFRMGDFFEMFFDDAVKAAPILNIALTSRNKSQGQDVPMCGVPHHSIGPQINKLLSAGLKVAICDQIEDPKAAKGIVKRAVTRVVTPGLVYDPETLDATSTNFVVAVIKDGENNFEMAGLDASTGELWTAQDLSRGELSRWIYQLEPKEILVEDERALPFETQVLITKRSRAVGQSPEEFLLTYARETQGEEVTMTLRAPQRLSQGGLRLSPTTIRHLELFKRYDGEIEGSLFDAVNLTQTPMGARLLKKRLASPWGRLEDVLEAQKRTDFLVENEELRGEWRRKLSQVGDLERKVARLSNPLCNARDLQALGLALQAAHEIVSHPSLFLNEKNKGDFGADRLARLILSTLQDELPHSTKEGCLIRPGLNSVLDEYVDLTTHAQTKLSQLEAKEKATTGIQSLKIKYNSVFGYSFEVTKANLDKVPGHFVRRQTLAQGERFVTQELSDLEQKILSSQQKRWELEFQMFQELRQKILKEALELLRLSSELADLDLSASLAQLAREQNYCRPQFQESGLELKDSRHAVLEKISPEPFIPNDVKLDGGHCLLLTGPNMAGKSTLMRQVALIAILAQCGSYVPAREAKLPLFDEIFTRIGASDNLSRGLSTFMVEMTETSEIIRSASGKSLVILDEIGRGTSTYDGMSLAQAVLEYFLKSIRPYTFFATHYHELTDLAQEHREITNAHMSIKEHKGQLIFLRKLKNGPANRSYGIEVAKQAGLPPEVTQRAQAILQGLATKSRELGVRQLNLLDAVMEMAGEQDQGRDLADIDGREAVETLKPVEKEILEEFRRLKMDHMTPIEALLKLSGLQKTLLSFDENLPQ